MLSPLSLALPAWLSKLRENPVHSSWLGTQSYGGNLLSKCLPSGRGICARQRLWLELEVRIPSRVTSSFVLV